MVKESFTITKPIDLDKFKVGSYYFCLGKYTSKNLPECWILRIEEAFVESLRESIKNIDYHISQEYSFAEIDDIEMYNRLKTICIHADEWR